MTLAIARTLILDPAGTIFLQWPSAGANASLVYGLNIAAALAVNSDQIAQISLNLSPSGTGEMQPSNLGAVNQTMLVTLSGGVPGRIYTARFVVTTTQGQTLSWLCYVTVALRGAIPPFSLPPDSGFGPAIIFNEPQRMELENGAGFWLLQNGTGVWVWS